MTVTDIASVIGALKTAVEITRGMISLNTDNAVKEKTSALLDSLISIQLGMISLQNEYTELLKKNQDLEAKLVLRADWDTIKSQYSLALMGRGYAMVPNSNHPNPEPRHYLCPTCFETMHISYFQKIEPYGQAPYICTTCKATVYLG